MLSESKISLPAVDVSTDWQPTPMPQDKLFHLNNFLARTDGRISPIRSQLNTEVTQLSPTSTRYYKRKAIQSVDVVLDAIAPGNSNWLLNQISNKARTNTETLVEADTLLSKLTSLYEETESWYTRQQILSIFVDDFSKTELLKMIPGLTKWRIDEARKHASEHKPGQIIEPPPIKRCRLDPTKVDHFLDFISSPSFLQDVAY